ncbi:MAG: hypothetical protein IT268_03110 [Saprospiraceae bacterium]|nr:hypothetical protein [Saprospiraceae bacterium]
MKANNIIVTFLYIIVGLMSTACNTDKNTSVPTTTPSPKMSTVDSLDNLVGVVRTTELINYISLPDGYFLKNTVNLADEYEGFLFENQNEFDNVIGFGKTANNAPIHINFDENVVVGIAGKAKAEHVRIKPQTILKRENEIVFKFSADKPQTQSFQSTPLFLLYIPKSALHNIRKMQLNGKDIKLNDQE